MTWKILNEAIQGHNPQSNTSNKFQINGNKTEDPQIIAQEFNNYFANIGKITNNAVPHTNKNYTDFLRGQNQQNLFMKPVLPDDIVKVANKMKPKSSCGFDLRVSTETGSKITYCLKTFFQGIQINIVGIEN